MRIFIAKAFWDYDRSLLGKLCCAAYDTVCDVFKLETDSDGGVLDSI